MTFLGVVLTVEESVNPLISSKQPTRSEASGKKIVAAYKSGKGLIKNIQKNLKSHITLQGKQSANGGHSEKMSICRDLSTHVSLPLVQAARC